MNLTLFVGVVAVAALVMLMDAAWGGTGLNITTAVIAMCSCWDPHVHLTNRRPR